jgi:hypothetical protein
MADQNELNRQSYVLPGLATVTVEEGIIREVEDLDENGNPKRVLHIIPESKKAPGPTLQKPVELEYRVKASQYPQWIINGKPAPRAEYWAAFGVDPSQALIMNIPATLKIIIEPD